MSTEILLLYLWEGENFENISELSKIEIYLEKKLLELLKCKLVYSAQKQLKTLTAIYMWFYSHFSV